MPMTLKKEIIKSKGNALTKSEQETFKSYILHCLLVRLVELKS